MTCGSEIEFVKQWPHFDHFITAKLCDDDDIQSRKIRMMGQVNNLLCKFSCLDSVTKKTVKFKVTVAVTTNANYGI
jgi:hypothetical protein